MNKIKKGCLAKGMPMMVMAIARLPVKSSAKVHYFFEKQSYLN